MEKRSYWLPTIQYSVVDAINRYAAATGSVGYAMNAANADYNGHQVSVSFNEYRGYWIAQYYWGERVVLSRGKFENVLKVAVEEYKRGALGTTVIVDIVTEEQEDYCKSLGFVEYSKELEEEYRESWVTDLHKEVPNAFLYHKQLGCPAPAFLANSKNLEEYKEKVDQFMVKRRGGQDG